MHLKLTASLVLIIISNSAIANSSTPIIGSYVGEAQNSEEMAKTMTSLTQNDKGIISGNTFSSKMAMK